jgi:hypothetical protein
MSKTTAKVFKAPQPPPSRLRQFLSPGYLLIAAGVLILAFLLVVIVRNTVAEQNPPGDLSIPDTSVSYPNQGQTHIEVGASHPAYNSNPPTSGWHYIDPAPWGIYPNQLPDETLIHNLEHGGIWLSYKDPTNQDIINQLTDIASHYPTHIIVAPRPQDDSPVAVAAWGQLLKMDTVNYDVIYAFIRRYRKHGPENVG